MKDLAALSEVFWGDLIGAGDPGYEKARRKHSPLGIGLC
jgi:hypothetical protein